MNYELMTWCTHSLGLWGLLWNIILFVRSATLINGNLSGTGKVFETFRISFKRFSFCCTYMYVRNLKNKWGT